MDQPFWAKYRREQLAEVEGDILEIGVGTGLNLPHYPEHVKRISTVDPNPGMNKKLQRRIDEVGSRSTNTSLAANRFRFPKGLLIVLLVQSRFVVFAMRRKQ